MKLSEEVYRNQLKILEDKMDKQQAFYDELWSFVDKHGADNLPPEYTNAWLKARLQGRKHWRKCPSIVRRIKKTAKKAAKNFRNNV